MLEIIHNSLYRTLLSNVDMSVNQFAVEPIQSLTCYAIQASWTAFTVGTATTIATSASNDGIIWTQIDSIIPTGTTGSYMLNVEKAGYRFVRIDYAQSGSVGSLTVSISGKVI